MKKKINFKYKRSCCDKDNKQNNTIVTRMGVNAQEQDSMKTTIENYLKTKLNWMNQLNPCQRICLIVLENKEDKN